MMDIKKTHYWQVFADLFAFIKAHYPATSDPQYWDKACCDAAELASKYQGQRGERLINAILTAILEDLAV